jgi:hypothetical protein
MKRRTLLQSIPAALLPAGELVAATGKIPGADADSNKVYELRVYHCYQGKLPDLLRRFREHTTKLFEKHEMKNVAYWTPTDDPQKSNMLVYILEHPGREAARANWKSFEEDPDWQTVKKATEANGKIVERVEVTFMELTDFSPPLR